MKSSKTTITLKVDGSDLGAQYVKAMERTPFNVREGDELPEHLRLAPGELPATPAPAAWPRIVPIEQQQSDGGQSGDPPAGFSPWPAPPEPSLAPDGGAQREDAADEAESQRDRDIAAWPMPPEPVDPTTRQPWETVAKVEDYNDGYRFRSQTVENTAQAGDRVYGISGGYVCRVCGRESRVFVFVEGEASARDACCAECASGLDRIIDQMGGEAMAGDRLTDMEVKAVQAARLELYNAIVAAGIATPEQMQALVDAGRLSAEKIDELTLTIWNAVRTSMQHQSTRGEIPF